MEVRDLAAILWRRKLLVLLVVVTTTVLSGVFALTRPDQYESVSTMALNPSKQSAGFVTPETLNALVGTYAQTAKSSVMLERAERRLGEPLPGSIETSTQAGTGILQVIGKADSADGAATTAQAVSEAFTGYLTAQESELFEPQIVDPAVPPSSPAQPRPPLIIGIGILLGLLGGAMLAYVIEQFRGRIETSDDIAELTSVPIVGSLPHQRRLARSASSLVWDDLELTSMHEALRALRTNMEILVESQQAVLQVTSPLAEEGKSTVVANLGVALSQLGIKTLIVDADLRRPSQHEIFNVSNDVGLSTALSGQVDKKLRQAATGYPGLSLLPSGPIPPDSTEMLHVRSASLIETLRETDSLVLLDSPPILPVSDARILAGRADGVLVVVAAQAEKPAVLRGALQTLQFAGASILGIVLNHAVESLARSGYEYHRVRGAGKSSTDRQRQAPVAR